MKGLYVFILGAMMGGAIVSFAQAPNSPSVIEADAAPVRVAPSGKARVRPLATGQEAFLGLLELDPGAAVPLHRDATEEYIYVLEGDGVMTLNGERVPIRPGTAVYMPANAEVSFTNGNAPTRVLQVFADPDPSSKYDAWTQSPPSP